MRKALREDILPVYLAALRLLLQLLVLMNNTLQAVGDGHVSELGADLRVVNQYLHGFLALNLELVFVREVAIFVFLLQLGLELLTSAPRVPAFVNPGAIVAGRTLSFPPQGGRALFLLTSPTLCPLLSYRVWLRAAPSADGTSLYWDIGTNGITGLIGRRTIRGIRSPLRNSHPSGISNLLALLLLCARLAFLVSGFGGSQAHIALLAVAALRAMNHALRAKNQLVHL